MIQHISGYNTKRLISYFAVGLACLFFVSAAATTASEFPGRATYPNVDVIELDALKEMLGSAVLVDVRSAYEYHTLRIKSAINIPVAEDRFVSKVSQLRASTNKPIVFYCNGRTCMKSYQASEKCVSANIPDVHTYDAGIMDWAKAYPKDSLLLGKSLNNPRLLISKTQFKKHLLDLDQFANKVASEKYIVLDVRDRFQRDALAIFPGREERAYLDQTKKLDHYIRLAKKQKRALLIYDAAGKQVRWLQYYLEYKRAPDYFFMKGGARAFYTAMTNQFIKRK